MLTQTLRGLVSGQKLHWRGDRATLADFNPTFRDLMGGNLISQEDIADLQSYLSSLRHHPNPNRNLDNTRPTALQGGNANNGRLLFLNVNVGHCVDCHALPTGSDNNIDLMAEVGSTQPVKTAPLRTTYQRTGFNRTAGAANVSGFGLLKDGTASANSLPTTHDYVLDQLSTPQQFADVRAFVLSFDTGSPPITGYSRTLSGFPAPGSPAEADLNLLEARASTTESDLVVRGLAGGRPRQFYWNRSTFRYVPDTLAGLPLTRALLLESLTPGDALTFTATLPGLGTARGHDRDENGVPDGDEPLPLPALFLAPEGLRLSWSSSAQDWYPETAASLNGAPWSVFTSPAVLDHGSWQIPLPSNPSTRFFRLRRTW
jgi:hypothetical protein